MQPACSYGFPPAVTTPLPRCTVSDLPGSSTDLSLRAVPSHPGKSGNCSCPLLHRRCQASSKSGGLSTSASVTRPKRVRLRYGSQVRLSRLRGTDCPVPRSIDYMLKGQLHGEFLSTHEISQTCPGAPDTR